MQKKGDSGHVLSKSLGSIGRETLAGRVGLCFGFRPAFFFFDLAAMLEKVRAAARR